jgi:hypothetical protein
MTPERVARLFGQGSCRGERGPSPETLNLRHMIGCLTAPPGRSREAGLFVPIPSGAIPVGIGNENDQVS